MAAHRTGDLTNTGGIVKVGGGLRLWHRATSLFRNFTRREQDEWEMAVELISHLQLLTREKIQSGMSPEEAQRAAQIELGGMEQVKEQVRDARSGAWLYSLVQDTRYGLRMACKSRGFTAIVVLTLALGIGMNTAMFSVVNAVLLRPLPYPDADRLVWLSDWNDWGDGMVFPAAYASWKDAAKSFSSMVAYGDQDLAFVAAGEASQERIASVGDGFWNLAGARAEVGRLFNSGEPNVIVLSHALYERRFAGNPHALETPVALNGHPFTVIGVLPPNFEFLFPQQSLDERRQIDAYIPLPAATLNLWSVTIAQFNALERSVGPTPWAVDVIGKLRPEVPFGRAQTEMKAIYARVKRENYRYSQSDLILHIEPLKKRLVGNTRPALMVLFGAVGFVLLIACVNIANLLLARGSARQKEFAIRASLGGTGGRLLRQLMVENSVLSLLGGFAGLVIAYWTIAIMVRLGSEVVPRVGHAQISGGVLLFTLAVSLATAFVFGAGPALSLLSGNAHGALKQQTLQFSIGSPRFRFLGLLNVAELALAIVLLTGAGLMVKSLWRMSTYPPGFEPEKVLVMRVALSGPQYAAPLQQDAYIRELQRRIESLPGVQAVGVQRGTLTTSIELDGNLSIPPDKKTYAALQGVSTEYLRALGVPLLKGHWPRDGSFDTFVVNETFARRMFANGEPIGRRVTGALMDGIIVGVVADFKAWQLDAEPGPEVYIPYLLLPGNGSVRVAARSLENSRMLAPLIPRLASAIDPTQPLYQLQALDEALLGSIAPRRFNLYLLSLFAIVALCMAIIGVHAVAAYSVSLRTREIGIRMALGAQRIDVAENIIREALKVTLTGIVIGLFAALGLTRLMGSLLYDVKPNDPLIFGAVAAALAATSLLACWRPILRAATVDPVVALRYE